MESIGRLAEENKGPDGNGADVVAGRSSPERVVLTSFTESLTTAAAVSDDGESTPATNTSLGVQAGTSASSWEFGGVDWLAGIRRGVDCFVTSVVTVDTIFSNRSAGNG